MTRGGGERDAPGGCRDSPPPFSLREAAGNTAETGAPPGPATVLTPPLGGVSLLLDGGASSTGVGGFAPNVAEGVGACGADWEEFAMRATRDLDLLSFRARGRCASGRVGKSLDASGGLCARRASSLLVARSTVWPPRPHAILAPLSSPSLSCAFVKGCLFGDAERGVGYPLTNWLEPLLCSVCTAFAWNSSSSGSDVATAIHALGSAISASASAAAIAAKMSGRPCMGPRWPCGVENCSSAEGDEREELAEGFMRGGEGLRGWD